MELVIGDRSAASAMAIYFDVAMKTIKRQQREKERGWRGEKRRVEEGGEDKERGKRGIL